MYAYKHYNPNAKRPILPPNPTPAPPIPPAAGASLATSKPPPSMSFSWSSLFADTRSSKRLAQRFLLPAGTQELLAPKSANIKPEDLVRAGGGDVDIFGGIARDVAGLNADKNTRDKMRKILAMFEDMADQWETSKAVNDVGSNPRAKAGFSDGDSEVERTNSHRGRTRTHSRHHSDPSGGPRRSDRKGDDSRSSSSDEDGDEASTVKPNKGHRKLRRVMSDLVNPFDNDEPDAKRPANTEDGGKAERRSRTTEAELKFMGKDEMKALLKRLEKDRDADERNVTHATDGKSSSSSGLSGEKEKSRAHEDISTNADTRTDKLERDTPERVSSSFNREGLRAETKHSDGAQSRAVPSKGTANRGRGNDSSLLSGLTQADLANMKPEELKIIMQRLKAEKGRANKSQPETPSDSAGPTGTKLGPDPLAAYAEEDLKLLDPDEMKRLVRERERWKKQRDTSSANSDPSRPAASDLGPDPLAGFSRSELAKLAPDDLKKLMSARKAWKSKRDATKGTEMLQAKSKATGSDPLAGLAREDLEALEPAGIQGLMKAHKDWSAGEKASVPAVKSRSSAKGSDLGPDPLAGYSKEELKGLDPEELTRLTKKRSLWKAKRDAANTALTDVPAALMGISKADLQSMNREDLKALLSKCDKAEAPGASEAAISRLAAGNTAKRPFHASEEQGQGKRDEDDEDDLAGFLPPLRRGRVDKTTIAPSGGGFSLALPRPPRQSSNTATPQNLNWPDRAQIARNDGAHLGPRSPLEALQSRQVHHASDTESIVLDLRPPSPLYSEFNISFPETPGHEPGGFVDPRLARTTSDATGPVAPSMDAQKSNQRSQAPKPGSNNAAIVGLADQFLHPEIHPRTTPAGSAQAIPPVSTQPVSLRSDALARGPTAAPVMENPLFSRVVRLLEECFSASRELDHDHTRGMKPLGPSPEHHLIRRIHHWLEKQLGPLKSANELFLHADSGDMLELLEASAKLHGHLELPHLRASRWEASIHQELDRHSDRLRHRFLRMAAGAVLYYMMSKIWHLSSGMLRTLEESLRVVHNEQSSPESVLAVLPKIRGQLYSATKERMATPESEAELHEASHLLDILYEIASDVLSARASSIPRDPREAMSDPTPARRSQKLRPGDHGILASSDKVAPSQTEISRDASQPGALAARLMIAEREIQAREPPEPHHSRTVEAKDSDRDSLASLGNNLLGLAWPDRDVRFEPSPSDNSRFAGGRRPSVPEPKTPRVFAQSELQSLCALTPRPPPREMVLAADSDAMVAADYTPLQDLLESYFPGSGANLMKQLTSEHRSSKKQEPDPAPSPVASSPSPVDPAPQPDLKLSAKSASPVLHLKEDRTPPMKQLPTPDPASLILVSPSGPGPRPRPVRANAATGSEDLLLERPAEALKDAAIALVAPTEHANASVPRTAVNPPKMASKILATPARNNRRSRPTIRARNALLRSTSIASVTPFTPALASPLRESAIADAPLQESISSLASLSDKSTVTTTLETASDRPSLEAGSDSQDLSLPAIPILSDTIVDVGAIAEREAQEELEALEAEDRVPVLSSEEIVASRADRLASITDNPDIRRTTAAEKEFAEVVSPGGILLDGSIPGPRIFTADDVRAGHISYQDVPEAVGNEIPRLEVTPGAIQNTYGDVVALEDEGAHLQMGETLIDGTGRMWNKNGLVEPGTDDDGDDILYDEDYAQLKRDNYGRMPVYMPWERDEIGPEPGALTPTYSDSEDGRSLSVASDFSTRSAQHSPSTPGSLEETDGALDPPDLEPGEPGLDEIALMERAGVISGIGTPVPYQDMTLDDNLPKVE